MLVELSECLLPMLETEEPRRDDVSSRFRNELNIVASCPEGGATSQEDMAFMMTDSGTASSSGGEFCHLSIGVMRVSLLAGIGDPDRQI
jgi:hypothetical protein